MRAPVPVVTIWLGGHPYKWADQMIEIRMEDGNYESIPGGLESCEVDEAGDSSPGGADADFDPSPVDLAALAADGHLLIGAEAEVAVIEEGIDWENREILVYGTVTGGNYGEAGDLASVQIGATWDDSGLVPPADAVASTGYTAESQGMTLPYVIGKPTATPAVTYASGLAVIAGHPVMAANVRIRDVSTTPYSAYVTAPVTVGELGGRVVSWVPTLLLFTLYAVDLAAAQIEVDWSESEGGHQRVTPGTDSPRCLPDVAAVMLTYASVPWDRASFASATWAYSYLLDCYLDDSDSPVQILGDMLAGLPGRLEAGPRGLRLVGTGLSEPFSNDPGPLIDLDDGKASLDGGIEMTGGTPPAIVTVKYRPTSTGSLTASAILSTTAGPRIGARAASRSVARGTEQVTHEAPYVCEEATAYRIARAILSERAARRSLSWTVALPDLDLIVGQRVRVTRDGLYLQAHPAWVESIDRDFEEGVATVTVRLIDDPATR